MKSNTVPPAPGAPSLLITSIAEPRGLDLLGLRSPAENVATSMMNGVTTVSRLVRYLSARAWMINRYVELGGANERSAFEQFVAKVEAALAVSNEMRSPKPVGGIGSKKAAPLAAGTSKYVKLERLTKEMALGIYSGPSLELRIAWRHDPIPGLTEDRGRPLALAADAVLGKSVVADIKLSGADQQVPRGAIAELAEQFPLDRPGEEERQILQDAVMPPEPSDLAERNRLASYCVLLELAGRLKGDIDQDDVLAASVDSDVGAWPEQLHAVQDGWARFLVRDMLVAVHERAVAEVLSAIAAIAGTSFASREKVLARVRSADLARPLADLGLTGIGPRTPIRSLARAVADRTTPTVSRGGLLRWSREVDELDIMRALDSAEGFDAASLLPVAWLLAVRRMEHGLSEGLPNFDLSRDAFARLGVGRVIAPVVAKWRESDESLADVAAWLVGRSVDQHLRITWTRLHLDGRRDGAALGSDGRNWTVEGAFAPGRATARINDALAWLRQLALLGERGPTRLGRSVLTRSLRTLEDHRP